MKKPKDTRVEKLIKDARSRGGRPTQVIKNKKKYDRNRDKKVPDGSE